MYFDSEMLMFWVYILEDPNGKFYVGQTGNIEQRLIDHNRTPSFFAGIADATTSLTVLPSGISTIPFDE